VNHYPGWYHDPTGRHQERYFNSDGVPTQFVRNEGSESWDDGPAFPVEAPLAPPRPLASYRVPAGNEAYWAPEAPPRSALPPVPVMVRPPRNWWLIGAGCCATLVLLAVAIVAVIQQHNHADHWKNEYLTEATRYRTAEAKDVGMFAALVLSQQKLAAATTSSGSPADSYQTLATAREEVRSIAADLNVCANDTATVISEIQDSVRAGFIDPSLESNATDAKVACGQAQSESMSLQGALSSG
jgi:hypothetical protein